MAGNISRPRDVIGGALIAAVGFGFLVLGRGLEFGTARQMGPGYFPMTLSAILVVMGLALAIIAWRRPLEEGGIGAIPWRTLCTIIFATVFFGLTIRGLGLIPSLFICLFIVSTTSRYTSAKASAVLAAGLTVFCYAIFVLGLGLPIGGFGPWVQPSHWSAPDPAPQPPAEPSS